LAPRAFETSDISRTREDRQRHVLGVADISKQQRLLSFHPYVVTAIGLTRARAVRRLLAGRKRRVDVTEWMTERMHVPPIASMLGRR
jgi:hypothetical protein